ncbi:MAG: NUDIX hydrolase [Anaerolineaceae bacterium]|nr:NUDIX hydrolase [Anaerolineaceae bacterium]
MPENQWFHWAQQIQAIAQSGLHYTENEFDRERYEQMREIALQMIAAQSDLPMDKLQHIFSGEEGYTTPKVDVRGVVFKDGKLLLVHELSDGLWTLPGGWVDINEPPSLAVEREVFEESGYHVKARKIAGVFDRNSHPHPAYLFHVYKLFILCDYIDGKATSSIETDGAAFYALDELPPLSVARVMQQQIELMFTHLANPARPTDFD